MLRGKSTTTVGLLRLLDRVTTADLAAIDTEIANQKAKLAQLEALRTLLSTRRVPAPASTPPVPNGQQNGHTRNGDLTQQRRREVAQYLSQVGPTPRTKISKVCGIPEGGSLGSVLDHPWFERRGEGVMITPACRKEFFDEVLNEGETTPDSEEDE